MQAHQDLRRTKAAAANGRDEHPQHVIVMRIERPRSRRQRDERTTGIRADPLAERVARDGDAVAEVAIPLGTDDRIAAGW